MPVSAETLSLLISQGLSGDKLVEIVRSIDADLEAAQRPVRTLRQERNRRYYEKHKGEASESVLKERLDSDGVSDADRLNSDDLRHPSPPPKRYNQTPSTPLPSLRSGIIARSADFDRFYAAYPKHINADAAKRKFDVVVRSGVSLDDIMAGVERYARSVAGTEKQFIKAPDVWLNKGCWKDGLLPNSPAPKAVPASVWVEKDSEQGRAWWQHTFDATGKYPPTDKDGGWRFPASFPPAKDAAE